MTAPDKTKEKSVLKDASESTRNSLRTTFKTFKEGLTYAENLIIQMT
jgi:hypothetical protein